MGKWIAIVICACPWTVDGWSRDDEASGVDRLPQCRFRWVEDAIVLPTSHGPLRRITAGNVSLERQSSEQ